MFAASALAPDGSSLDRFVFDGALTVTYGCRASTPGSASGSSFRPPTIRTGSFRACSTAKTDSKPARGCTRGSPHVDVGRMESNSWSFRADRCGTPAVFAGRGLATTEVSPLGQSGVGFAHADGRPVIWLDFPYREEPLSYDGSETPAPADVQTYRWRPGETVMLEFDQLDGDWRSALRGRSASEPQSPPAAWVSLAEAAELAAWGLFRWHYRPDRRGSWRRSASTGTRTVTRCTSRG